MPQKSSKMNNYWMIMEFSGNGKSKTAYVGVEKTVLRVWLLFTVSRDHPVALCLSFRNAVDSYNIDILAISLKF